MSREMDTNNWQYVKEKQSPQILKNQQCREMDCSHGNTYLFVSMLRAHKGLLMLVLCAAVVSLPWEFMRLYQRAVADRASKIIQGAPPECSPENLTLFERIKLLLVAQFSWTHARDPCQEYYYALLVDPLWEVTPAMVLVSAFTRCCLHPLELISASLGYCLQLFFSQIPFQWQPFIFLVASVIIFVLLVMMCGYRLTIPWFLRLESRSPLRRQTCMRNINYQKEIAGENSGNTYCYERTYSPSDKAFSERSFLRPLPTISSEPLFNQNQCLQDSKPGKDCRSHNSQKETYNSTSVQSHFYVFNNNKNCEGSLRCSVSRKQNERDSLELPVSESLTGKMQKKKHQTVYKSRTTGAINVFKKGKSTVALNSRKSCVMKKKSKLDSLWMPKSEDYVSTDSE